MIKKIITITLLLVGVMATLSAQSTKTGYIQKDKILLGCKIGKIASAKMDSVLAFWESKFNAMQKIYNDKVSVFQAPAEEPPITMTENKKEEFRKEQEDKKKALFEEIQNMETEMLNFQNSIYGSQDKGGYDGQLMIKQNEILGPVMEKINNVATKYAIKNNYSMILQDKPKNLAVYLDPELKIEDITDQIIIEMDKLTD